MNRAVDKLNGSCESAYIWLSHLNRSNQWSYGLTGIFQKASFKSCFCSTVNLPCFAISAIALLRVWYESDPNSEGMRSLTDSFGGCDRSWIHHHPSNCP